MNIDVGVWLKGLGLGEYSASFEENHVDGEVLPHLTSDDLKDLGVAAVGHRRKLLEAIAALDKRAHAVPPDAQKNQQTQTTGQPESERRQVTVLFADLCGFTELSSSIDSEEVHALLAVYFGVADRIIGEFGGTVDKHVGDSVMGLFGAPISYGNDAERAVRAAIAIREAMPEISQRIGRSLQTHIGIASGQVVASGVGPDSHYTVIGDSVNLAARLTDKAKADEIIISEMVCQSMPRTLATTDVGQVSVKGLSDPVHVYSLPERQPPSDLHKARPFVGRLAEVRQFKIALDVCKEAEQGQLIHVRGDAGIGKTHLTDEFCRLASEDGFICHRTLTLDFGVGQGQDAIRTLVRGLLDIRREDGLEGRQAAVRSAIKDGVAVAENEVFLNDLLNLPQTPDQQALYDAMDNQTRIAGKVETVVALARALSDRHPRLIVFEDVHWADRLVLEHIANLAGGAADVPIVIVLTSRIEGDPIDAAWRGLVAGTPFMTLDLGPLSEADALRMAASFVDTADRLAKSCIERAAGNPLFLEQLLRSAQEAGDVQIPGSVQSIVQARLDRLPPADKTVVQAASVLGQHFTLAALRHLIGDDEYDCSKLVAHQLVREQGEGYLFAHALVRDGVYGSLLRARRIELHLAAADWFGGVDLPLRAEHMECAGHTDAAEAYLQAAEAQKTALRLESARQLAERGLAVADIPDMQFALNCLLGELLRELGESERSIEAYHEALSLCSDDPPKCFALLGIAEGKRIVERIDEALDILEQAQPIAEANELTEALMQLHHLRGNLLFPKGDIEGCEKGHRRSIEYARQIDSAEGEARGLGGLGDAAYVAGRMRTSHDMLLRCVEISRENGFRRTEVANAAQVCHTKMFLLELREALEMARSTIDAARRVGHDRAELNAAAACLFAAVELNDWFAAERFGEHVLTLGEKLGSVRFSQEGMAFKGVYLNAAGRHEEALASIEKAIAGARELGMSFGGPRMLGHLLRISQDQNVQDRAIAEAEDIIAGGCVGHNQPFFYRDAIEVMLKRGDWAQVERYADALEIFAQKEALPWTDFYVARARALNSWAQAPRDSDCSKALKAVRDDALRIGLQSAVPALDEALGSA